MRGRKLVGLNSCLFLLCLACQGHGSHQQQHARQPSGVALTGNDSGDGEIGQQTPELEPARAGSKTAGLHGADERPVLIVGAGMAGIGAAMALEALNRSYILLEARGRVGGRTHSLKDGPFARCDVGAHWIEGNSYARNPIKKLVVDHGLEYRQVSHHPIAGAEANVAEIQMMGPALFGDRWSRRQVDDAFRFFAAQCARLRGLYLRRLAQGLPDISIRAGFELISGDLTDSERALSTFFQHWWMGLDDASFVASDSLYQWIGEDANYEYLYDLSDPKGDGADVLTHGYGDLAETLAQGLNIELDAAVTGVEYAADGVTVSTATGQQFTGAAVIVTVPLAVLQAGKMAFSPPLSTTRMAALNALGMGLENHYYAKFSGSSIPARPYVTGFVAAAPDEGRLLPAWYNGNYETGLPVLNGMASGQWARHHEPLWRSAQLADTIRSIAAGIVASTDLPEQQTRNGTVTGKHRPAAPEILTHASRWASDEWARGSYSFYHVNTSARTRTTAFSKRDDTPNLWFAGEATCNMLYGTVPGAFVSGVRASYDLLGSPDPGVWAYFEARYLNLCDTAMGDKARDQDGDRLAKQMARASVNHAGFFTASRQHRRAFARRLSEVGRVKTPASQSATTDLES